LPIALVFGLTSATAMDPARPCTRPAVFSGGAVNAVVLPYRHTGADEARLGEAGARLSLLVHLEALFSMIKYGGVGAVRLVDGDDVCDPDRVLSQLLGEERGAASELAEGRGLVLVWGLIYEEGSDIFVQTYMRFLRRGIDERLTLAVEDRKFQGQLDSQAVAFPPRRLTQEDLARIFEEFKTAAALHEEADAATASQPLPLDPGSPESFWVTTSEGEWLHLKSQSGSTEGWLRARLGAGQWPLRRALPELGFLDGVAGYLRQRVGASGAASAAPERTVEWAVAALNRYAESEAEGAREPVALAVTLSGMLRAITAPESGAGIERALAEFERAEALVPYSANARNLTLITRIYAGYRDRAPGLQVRVVADDLLRAAGLEPDNPLFLANIANLYELLANTGPPSSVDAAFALSQEELTERWEFVRGVQVGAGSR
jgi:hypothetical protein